ncbi:MAG: transposase, partial [Planctomycetota bacterium]
PRAAHTPSVPRGNGWEVSAKSTRAWSVFISATPRLVFSACWTANSICPRNTRTIPRAEKNYVPDDIVFRTKPQIGLVLIDRALDNGIRVKAWTCDELYGRDGVFLDALENRRQAGLLVEVVRLAGELGLVRLGNLSLDSTKVRANASRHKAMSYGSMEKEVERLRTETAALLQQAEEIVACSGGRAVLAPPTTLPELAAVLRRARMFVGSGK